MSTSTQFISSVTAGSRATFGVTLVSNAAQGLFALGLASLSMGQALASDDAPARNITFDFQDVVEWQGRLDFDPQTRPFVPGGFYSFRSGELTLTNKAQGFSPSGQQGTRSGQAIVSDDAPARQLLFDFSLIQLGELALHFNFGGANVLAAQGVQGTRFGSGQIQGVISASPAGWQSTHLGQAVVSDDALARSLVFDFELVQIAELALHFNFAGANVLAPHGRDSLQIGLPGIENAAQGLSAAGWQSTHLGQAIVSDDALARSLAFDFVVTSSPSLPIQFVFGGNNRTARFDLGLDSFASGTAALTTPPVITPVGWDSLEVGGLGRMIWLVYPAGFNSFATGNNTGIHFPGYILGQGFQASQFGIPDFPGLVFSGLRSTAWGQAEVTVIAPPATQVLEAPFVDGTQIGTTFISNYWRLLDLDGSGVSAIHWAVPRLSYSPKFVQTPFDNLFLKTGLPRIGFGIEIVMAGVQPLARFGKPIIDHARIFPGSIHQTNYGQPVIENTAKAIRIDAGIRDTAWGLADVKTDLLIAVHYGCTTVAERCGSKFSQYASVANRNLTIRPEPHHSLRMAFFPAGLSYAGRPVFPTGFQSHRFVPSWQGSHLVAYRIREYTLGDYQSLIFPSWTRVSNAARVLGAQGSQGTAYGAHRLERLLQQVYLWGRNTLVMGSIEWISRSPRTLEVFYGISSLRIGQMPFVAHGSRYLEPEGIDSFRWASATVVGKPVPTIAPRWSQLWLQDLNLIGRPGVRNVTPQIWPTGVLATQMPVHPYWISHSPRHLLPQGFDAGRFGPTRIADRTRTIPLQGLTSTRFSQNTHFWHDPPVTHPPINTPIFPTGWNSLGMGAWTFMESVVRVQGLNSSSAGIAFVHANSIIFDMSHNPIAGGTTYGTAVLSGGIRPLAPEVVGTIQQGSLEVGKPRITPHTIWCRNDTPQQARTNHPGRSWCDVDRFCSDSHPFHGPSRSAGSAVDGPWFGRALAGNKGTQVCPITGSYQLPANNRYFFLPGTPQVTLGTNVFRLEGWRSFRAGFPVVLIPGTQVVTIWGSITETAYGLATLTDTGPRHVSVNGLGSLSVPLFEVQNLHRAVHPSGFEATIYGNNQPMVHFPRTVTPIDSDLTLFGLTWASHSPRWITAGDNDFFTARWTQHSLRMQVRNRLWVVKGYAYNVFAKFGQATIQTGDNHIGPYGINPPCVSPWITVNHDLV